MARNTQFSQLLVMLRQEIGRSSSVAVGVDDAPGLKQKLKRQQEILYEEYDWPFMRVRMPLSLVASERYYDLPTTTIDGLTVGFNIERIEEAILYYNNIPFPLTRGIDERDFASFNSDIGVISSPTLKWDVRWTGSPAVEQIEAWPIPSQSGDVIMFRGLRALRPLVNDSDMADLDDLAIVLPVAAELLAKSDAKSAQALAGTASRHINRLKGRERGSGRRYRLGMGNSPEGYRGIVIRVGATAP